MSAVGVSLPSWRAGGNESSGRFEGEPYCSDVSFFVVDAAPGAGPALHRHPYSETFVVQGGHGRFEVGDRSIEAVAGDVVVVPPDTAHNFRALAPGGLRLVAIHAAPRMETTWLEEIPKQWRNDEAQHSRPEADAGAHLTDGVQRALGRAPPDFADYARATAASGVWDASARAA